MGTPAPRAEKKKKRLPAPGDTTIRDPFITLLYGATFRFFAFSSSSSSSSRGDRLLLLLEMHHPLLEMHHALLEMRDPLLEMHHPLLEVSRTTGGRGGAQSVRPK